MYLLPVVPAGNEYTAAYRQDVVDAGSGASFVKRFAESGEHVERAAAPTRNNGIAGGLD